MKLDYGLLWGVYNFELWQTHLKHHVWLWEHDFLSHHHEWSCRWSKVPQEKLAYRSIITKCLGWTITWWRWTVLYLTMPSRYKTFRYHDVIRRRVSTECSSVFTYNVDIVEKLPFDSFQYKNVATVLLNLWNILRLRGWSRSYSLHCIWVLSGKLRWKLMHIASSENDTNSLVTLLWWRLLLLLLHHARLSRVHQISSPLIVMRWSICSLVYINLNQTFKSLTLMVLLSLHDLLLHLKR